MKLLNKKYQLAVFLKNEKWRFIVYPILFIVYVLVQIPGIFTEQLGYHEAITLAGSKLSIHDLLSDNGISLWSVTPFYYLLTKLIYLFIDYPLIQLRLLSLFAGGLLIVLLFRFFYKNINFFSALIVSLLVIINPVLSGITREATSLIWQNLFILLFLINGFKLIRKKTLTNSLLFVIFSILSICSSPWFFIVTLSFLLYWLYTIIRFKIEKSILFKELADKGFFVFPVSILSVLALPSVFNWLTSGFYPKADWTQVLRLESLIKSVGYIFTSKYSFDMNPFIPSIIIGGLSLFCIAFFIIYLLNSKSVNNWKIFACFITLFSILFFIIISSIFKIDLELRYVTFFIPFYLYLIYRSISVFPGRILKNIIFSFFMIMFLLPFLFLYQHKINGSGMDAALHISSKIKQESIIATDEKSLVNVLYYLNDKPVFLYADTDETVKMYSECAITKHYLVEKKELMQLILDEPFFIIATPVSKNSAEKLCMENDRISNPQCIPMVFKQKTSWLNFKIWQSISLRTIK